MIIMNPSGISSDRRVLDCRLGGHMFYSTPIGHTNTQGLKITEKLGYFLCPANG